MAYTLILAEKPSAAQKIATALSEGPVEKLNKHSVPYYRITCAGKDTVVVSAAGHLFVLTQDGKGWKYPVFDVKWEPVFVANKKNYWSKKYYDVIKDLAKGADEFISATDYDIEGSLIAYNILRFICGVKDAKRMKFSTLTKQDLVKAYDHASQHLSFGLIEAGLTRHELDWYFGINMSRALTLALKEGGGYKVLSTGRVQGPALGLLDGRELEIKKFKPEPFWQITLTGTICGHEIAFIHKTKRFWKKGEAQAVMDKCKGSPAVVKSVEKKTLKQAPPFPFDLTTLQREAYASFGFSPKQTLDVAQSLYEQAYISYPRTSSQKLPPALGLKDILTKLKDQKAYSKFCEKLLKKRSLRPNEGAKTDPAHPSIFPTGNKPKELNTYQKKLYDMIAKRFIAVFEEAAVRESMNIALDVNGETFTAQGTRTVEPNWMDVYKPYVKLKELVLPDVSEGDKVDIGKLEMLEKATQPPGRYTQASILKKLEDFGLGTKGTRALILQTLYDRGYIKERSILVTKLGHAVIAALDKYCKDIISVDLTKKFEEDMEAIGSGKKKRGDVVREAAETLGKMLERFKEHEKEVGEELFKSVKEVLREESTIGKCDCGGNIVIKTSRQGKRFAACDRYPKCTQTFSLPHTGSLTILSQKCDCGLHLISVKRAGKRPWRLCIRCGFANKKKEPGEKAKK
jgi:DNA topoisomerase-1